MQYCLEPGCPRLVTHGRCATHAQLLEQQRDNVDVRRWYRTVRWRRLRDQVLGEAMYTCARCGHTQVNLQVDHVRPHGGHVERFWNRANLQALCPSCHSAKTSREIWAPNSGGGV